MSSWPPSSRSPRCYSPPRTRTKALAVQPSCLTVLTRHQESTDAELLVLRHENTVLRRQVGWPGCGEIDVMEHFGTGPAAVHGTVHGPGYSGRDGISASHPVGPSLGRDFHVYSVAWDPGQIRWYVDDDLYHAVTPAELHGSPGSSITNSSCW